MTPKQIIKELPTTNQIFISVNICAPMWMEMTKEQTLKLLDRFYDNAVITAYWNNHNDLMLGDIDNFSHI